MGSAECSRALSIVIQLASSHMFKCVCNRLEDDIGLALATEEENMKYFPASNSSREVRDRLVGACTNLGVHIQCKASVEALSSLPGGLCHAVLARLVSIQVSKSWPFGEMQTSSSGRVETTSIYLWRVW